MGKTHRTFRHMIKCKALTAPVRRPKIGQGGVESVGRCTLKRLAISAIPLLAISLSPAPALAEQFGTILATAAGVIAGGVIGSAVIAGTTATIVGSAIGGSVACWWYDGVDPSSYEGLPRKATLQTAPAAHPAPGVVLISAQELQVVPTKR